MMTNASNLSNAQNQAAAANAVLGRNIATQQGFAGQNANTLQTNINSYAPGQQLGQLQEAQGARSAENIGNISGPDTGGIPTTGGAPAAVRGEIAKRMQATNSYAKGVAGAQGKLGGYNDSWLSNTLRNSQSNRDIGVVNNASEGRKALLKPEQDAAMAAAYSPPSPWGALLSGAGNIGASAAGARGFGLGGGARSSASAFNPNPYGDPSWAGSPWG
jgi:hypothetical protein